MPSYELSVILRSALRRPELKDALKGICNLIYEKEGVVRSMENLGARELPFFMMANGKKHFQGHYFIIKFDSSALKMFQLQRFYRREDDNIIRVGIVLNEEEPRRPCLDGPCRYGEIFPEHDKMAYKRGVYKKLKYPRAESTSKRYTT